jgi:hypothetical protein
VRTLAAERSQRILNAMLGARRAVARKSLAVLILAAASASGCSAARSTGARNEITVYGRIGPPAAPPGAEHSSHMKFHATIVFQGIGTSIVVTVPLDSTANFTARVPAGSYYVSTTSFVTGCESMPRVVDLRRSPAHVLIVCDYS